jgi:dTDP-4-amino-4,6-dideoxygalactose transaminase
MRTINLTKPHITDEELQAVETTLKSGWLIRGQETKSFEEEFAALMGAKYAVATVGCAMAIWLGLKEMKLTTTDEVIVPSFTWTATASMVIQAGATPVFADIKRDTWCLDPEDVRHKITRNTKLVMPVHYGAQYAAGFEDFEVPVLFDSAHRLGKNLFDGHESAHSFYAVKNMTTVRGGAILTNDENKAKYYRMLCSGGVNKDTLSRYQGGNKLDVSSFYFEVEVPSWNFDMPNVDAALGRVQLRKVESFNRRREEIVKQYNEAFGLNRTGNHLFPLLVKNRDEFLLNMKTDGIQCAIHYLPLHRMKAYAFMNTGTLPNTEFIGDHCVSLPLYPDMSQEDIDYVVEHVKKYADLQTE